MNQEFRDVEKALKVVKVEVERLRKENDFWRGVVANSELSCVYCKLSKADMNKCQLGFPGCARADDMLCAPAEKA